AISGFGRLKDRLDAAFGPDAEDWRIHDLRRTVATNMAMLRIQPQVIEAVLNHKSGIVSGVAAIYNRHAYQDEKREALEKWSEKLSQIVKAENSLTTAAWQNLPPSSASETIPGYPPSSLL